MLFSTGRMAALRCPLCGRFQTHAFSLFSFARGRPLCVNCGCGFNVMTISTPARRNYLIHISCPICADLHSYLLARGEFWNCELQRLRCPDLDMEIGYLGSETAVRQAIDDGRRDETNIASDAGGDNFFNQPEIMLEVLGYLHFLAENDSLGCQCGNRQIEIKVFPDKLELRCISCRSLLIVYAETPEDLATVRRMPRISMSVRGFASIDASKLTQER